MAAGSNVTITSPMYGTTGHYPHNVDCRWGIVTSQARELNISTLSMALEHHQNCRYDYVDIYKRFRTNMTLIRNICKPLQKNILTNGSAFFHFHSDVGLNDDGFQIQIRAAQGKTTCFNLNSDI